MDRARFSYDVLPADRRCAIDFIRQAARSARGKGLKARLVIPLTCGDGDRVLRCEAELNGLHRRREFCPAGIGSSEQTGRWMQALSEVHICRPEMTVVRVINGGQEA
jgi:hypothetical protein